MFAGHLGAGLILRPMAKRRSLGSLFLAAMLLDAVLWVLVLSGVESVHTPANFKTAVDFTYDFPWSHSLVAGIGWSVLAFLAAPVIAGRKTQRYALILAAAVFSHFVLDWIVHVVELPLAGRESMKFGLGLWRTSLPIAWGLEAAIAVACTWCFLRYVKVNRARRICLIIVMALVIAMTIAGQASHSAPPAPTVMAGSSLATIALLVLFAWWIDRDSLSKGA